MAILRTTVQQIARLAADQPSVRLEAAGFGWSVNEQLAHLRACQDVLGGNMRRILAEEHPAWKRASPRAWHRKSGYSAWEFGAAFDEFQRQRTDLLAVLEPLSPATWARTATVSEASAVRERSMLFFGDWMARHEVQHLEQMADVLAKLDAAHRG